MTSNGATAKRGGRALVAPHFVGIGAPRSGTSWLYAMLRLHPRAWMPWKEVHYFDSIDPATHSGYHIQSRLFRLRMGWRYLLRRLAIRSVPGASRLIRRYAPVHALHAGGWRWSARYLFGRVSPEWYEGLFREGVRAGLVCGEITPAYFMLSERGISEFSATLPDARAIVVLRNPLDWAWSGLCRELRHDGLDPARLSDAELIERCPVPSGRSRQDFGSNLRRWFDHFPRDRLLVCFHDDIRSEPAAVLERVCEFTGLGAFPAQLRSTLEARVNSSARGAPPPKAVARHVAERYRSETELVASLVGGHAERWVEELQKVLRGN
jgi:hypothetical protein